MKDMSESSSRYTSYHSDKTFSILVRAVQAVKNKEGFEFENSGLQYSVRSRSYNLDEKWVLICVGQMYEYLMPWAGATGEVEVLAELDRENFEKFIETFEIEGKTVRWILEHQKEWKYKLTANHLEKILTGFSFWFVYRKMPGAIYSGGRIPRTVDGRYILLLPAIRFDVTSYAPTVPGAEHWLKAGERQDIFMRHESSDCVDVEIGPFKTDGELLDSVKFNGKTLREIFDTEYDDGEIFCGEFEG
jgi:hypothetical protein